MPVDCYHLLCRLCSKSYEWYINVFDTISEGGIAVSEMIRDLLEDEVHEGDGLPTTACHKCWKKLMEYYDFKRMCIKSAKELRRNVITDTIKTIEDDEIQLDDSFNLDIESVPKAEPDVDVPNQTEGSMETDVMDGDDGIQLCDSCTINNAVVPKMEPIEDTPNQIEIDPSKDVGDSDPLESTNILEETPEHQAMTCIDTESEEPGQGVHGGRVVLNKVEMLLGTRSVDQLDKSTSLEQEHLVSKSHYDQRILRPRSILNKEKAPVRKPIRTPSMTSRKEVDRRNALKGEGRQSPLEDRADPVAREPPKTTRKSTLQAHMMVHSSARTFACDQCSKAFNRKSELRNHKMVHSGSRPFVCDQCSKAFSRKRTLQDHMTVHSGERPFVCDQCSKSFTRKCTLQYHKMVHSGLKPFVCDQCSKSFTRKCTLRNHKAVHSCVT